MSAAHGRAVDSGAGLVGVLDAHLPSTEGLGRLNGTGREGFILNDAPMTWILVW
jgi:hypothetical protein